MLYIDVLELGGKALKRTHDEDQSHPQICLCHMSYLVIVQA